MSANIYLMDPDNIQRLLRWYNLLKEMKSYRKKTQSAGEQVRPDKGS